MALRLAELEALRDKYVSLTEAVGDHLDADAKERGLLLREVAAERAAVEVEKERGALLRQRLEVLEEQVRFYKDAAARLGKGSGAGCRVLRVVTLGIKRCRPSFKIP